MKKLLVLALITLSGSLFLNTQAQFKKFKTVKASTVVLNNNCTQQIKTFMEDLATNQYPNEIHLFEASERPINYIAFHKNPDLPETNTPPYTYVGEKKSPEPVQLINGKPEYCTTIYNFAQELIKQNPKKLGYTCAGGIEEPKNVILKFDNPHFTGLPGSGRYCRVFIKEN